MQSVQPLAHRFTQSRQWNVGVWAGTTYRWHPRSEAPSIVGIIFGDCAKAQSLFQIWFSEMGNHDELEELRLAIIEGDIAGQEPGYSIHLCPHPENIALRATAEGRTPPADLDYTGRVSRMHPQYGNDPSMLPTFKREYAKHGRYMLAPVTPREDGQFWFDIELGIEKTELYLRDAADITDSDDIDAAVLRPIVFAEPDRT